MISLDGSHLTFDQFQRVSRFDEEVQIDPAALPGMLRSRAVVETLALGDAPVYAVNTGVGLLADVRVRPPNSNSSSATWFVPTPAESGRRWLATKSAA